MAALRRNPAANGGTIGLSPKVHLETVDFYQDAQAARDAGAVRIPAIVLGAKGDSRAKFYGIPTGYGLATIVAGIRVISRGVSPLSMNTRKKLRQINRPLHIQVFVTPTDSDCLRMAQLASRIRPGLPVYHVGRSGNPGVPSAGPGLRGQVGAGDGNQRTHPFCRARDRGPAAGENAPSRGGNDADGKGQPGLGGPKLSQEKAPCLKS